MQSNFMEQCEAEKLHLSGSIQPHGALIVLDLNGKITHYSDNIKDFLADDVALEVGHSLPQHLDEIFQSSGQKKGEHTFTDYIGQGGELLSITICLNETAAVIELYPCEDSSERIDVLKLPALFNDQDDLTYWRNQLIKWIAAITKHERTMYYQFMEQGDGLVTDEICTEDAEGTYLDLRFPASDIPQIAREFYVKNPWRMIPDAQKQSVAIKGVESPPDLTYADLRSVSPIHQIYMKNMGVGSSVSFPIVRNGELDALISCHSAHNLLLDRNILVRISGTIGHFSSLLKEFDIRQRMAVINEFNHKNAGIRAIATSEAPLDVVLESLSQELLSNLSVDGVTFCTDELICSYGETLNKDALELIDSWFINLQSELIFQTDHLSGFFAESPLTEVAGVCGLKFRSSGSLVRVYLTRGEHIYEVKWGGNPNKPTETHDGQYGISPRQSFSKWVERRLGYCKPWPSMMKLELHRLRAILESCPIFIGK